MIPVALLIRASPYLVAVAVLGAGVLYVRGLQAKVGTQHLAIQKLGARAAELHGAYERERKARHDAQVALGYFERARSQGAARQAASRRRVAGAQGVSDWAPAAIPRAMFDELRVQHRDAAGADSTNTGAAAADGAVPGRAGDQGPDQRPSL